METALSYFPDPMRSSDVIRFAKQKSSTTLMRRKRKDGKIPIFLEICKKVYTEEGFASYTIQTFLK